MEPGSDGFGVPLKTSLARQLLLLKPADYDFSGDRSQWALPSPAEKREECGRVRKGGGEGRREGVGGRGKKGKGRSEATVRLKEHRAHTHATCGKD